MPSSAAVDQLRSHVYKCGNQWRVDTPQSPVPVQLFNWSHAMDIANEYAQMAQFAARGDTGPSWRELAVALGLDLAREAIADGGQ